MKILETKEVAEFIAKMLFDEEGINSREASKDTLILRGETDRCNTEITVKRNHSMIEIYAATVGPADTLDMNIAFQILAEDATEARLTEYLRHYMSELNFY